MTEQAIPKLYIVNSELLPEVFIKVCKAKELLETGDASTVAEAVGKVGISRSAFYKYKDGIAPFRDMKQGQVLTLSLLMRDRSGALSSVLSIFAELRANILNITQSIPSGGVAMVTISLTAEDNSFTVDELRQKLEAESAVVRVELLAK